MIQTFLIILLDSNSKEAIDWAQVDLKEATKSDTFDMAAVDWTELNDSKSAANLIKQSTVFDDIND